MILLVSKHSCFKHISIDYSCILSQIMYFSFLLEMEQFVLFQPLLFIAGKVYCDEGMAVQSSVMLESFGFS